MRKAIEFIKWPMAFPILGLAGLYLFWFLSAPTALIAINDNFTNFILGLIIFSIYVIGTIFAKIAWSNWKLSLGLLILMAVPAGFIVLLNVNFFSDYSFPDHESVLYITGTILLSIYPMMVALRDAIKNLKIMQLLSSMALTILLSGNLLYLVFFYPVTEETVTFGSYNYYVVSSRDSDAHWFETFYKCQKIGFVCYGLDSSYSWPISKIIIDEQNNEVSLLGVEGLIYTDGADSRAYARGAVVQFRNSIYQLSEKCNNFNNKKGYWECETNTYRLYQCNPDYKSCNPLPVQYTDEFDLDAVFEVNQATNEIALYDGYNEDGRTLIFTYGEHPRCYAEGCVITQP